MRAAFNGDGFVDDVAFNTRGRGQADLQATHAAYDAAVDHNVVGNHFAFDGGGFADGQKVGADVAFDGAFDLNVTGGFQIAFDVQVCGQNRCANFWTWRCRWGRGRCRCGFFGCFWQNRFRS